METRFSPAQLADPATARSEAVVRKCVHCGFCVATCPTYVLLGDERDSPRGRIYLLKNMLENDQTPTPETVLHVDRCLSCLSCRTTCPSGVDYEQLIDHGRAYIERRYRRPPADRLIRALLAHVLPHRRRFRLALGLAALGRPFAPLLRRSAALKPLAAMLALAPRRTPKAAARPASGPHARRVLMLRGCAEPVLAPRIQAAAIRLLDRAGVGVDQVEDGCCGALVRHLGREDQARALARANIDRWSAALDDHPYEAILTTASGCGVTLKNYGALFVDEPAYAAKAARIAGLIRDLSEILAPDDLSPSVIAPGTVVAYHAACSLRHGQGLDAGPKRLLARAGFEVREPVDAHLCCGSAGTYNILQSDIAGRLGARKSETLAALEPRIIASGNIGCITQLAATAAVPVVHTVELLDWAAGGPAPLHLSVVQTMNHH
jgi:glycolate oxidase iron-sulfur subunit